MTDSNKHYNEALDAPRTSMPMREFLTTPQKVAFVGLALSIVWLAYSVMHENGFTGPLIAAAVFGWIVFLNLINVDHLSEISKKQYEEVTEMFNKDSGLKELCEIGEKISWFEFGAIENLYKERQFEAAREEATKEVAK